MIQKIQNTDTLETGFRSKYNETVDEIASDNAAVEGGTNKPYFPKFGGGKLYFDAIFSLVYTKNEIAAMFGGGGGGIGFVPSATETEEGTVEIATTEEAKEFLDNRRVITAYTLGQVLAQYFVDTDAFINRGVLEEAFDFDDLSTNGAYEYDLDNWTGVANHPPLDSAKGIVTTQAGGDWAIQTARDENDVIAVRLGVNGAWGVWKTEADKIKGIILDEFFSPEAAGIVGNVDQETAAQKVPVITYNKDNIPVDYNEVLPNFYFRPHHNAVALVKTLFAKNSDGSPAKIAQNGKDRFWTQAIESIADCPKYPDGSIALYGPCDIVVETIEAYACIKVISYLDRRVARTYTSDAGSSPTWSQWQFETTQPAALDAGRLIKAVSAQGIANANIGEFEDGTYWVFEAIKFALATLSVPGRVAAFDPSFEYDLVNLRTLDRRLDLYLPTSYLSPLLSQILTDLQGKASLGHGHEIGEINNLQTRLNEFILKSVLTEGNAYNGLGRDINGNAIMIDNSRVLVNADRRLPRWQEGQEFAFNVPNSVLDLPTGIEEYYLIVNSSGEWLDIWWTLGDGTTYYGTPDSAFPVIVTVQVRYRFSNGDWMEDDKTFFISVIPAVDTVTAPSAPSSLTAIRNTANPQHVVDLSLVDTSDNETNFVWERSPDTVTWEVISITAANQNTTQNTGLASDTLYHYRARAVNSEGYSAYVYADVTTAEDEVVTPPVNARVAGTTFVKAWSTIVVPPDPKPTDPPNGNFFGGDKPKSKLVGLQPASFVQADRIIWKHHTTGELKVFDKFDQNNNPEQVIPSASDWFIYTITDFAEYIDNASGAGMNLCAAWLRWTTYQVSATRFMNEIPAWLLKYGAEKGVYIDISIIPDCGNGGGLSIFGPDQTATWRYLQEDIMRVQKFAGEGGSPSTQLGHMKDGDGYPPCLLRERVQANLEKMYTAYANYIKTDPNKAVLLCTRPILANTGESHVPINQQAYCDAHPTVMSEFFNFLTYQPASVQAKFSAFMANPTDTGNTDARNFMRGYSDGYAIWQYWFQHQYFWGSYNNTKGGIYTIIGNILKNAGLGFGVDLGSATDGNAERVDNYAIDPRFTAGLTSFKTNPAGDRDGYVEAAAVRATGKNACLEWTPGALADYGSIENAVNKCTEQAKDTLDADVIPFFSFVAKGGNYDNILKPIIANLKAAGYWSLDDATYTPSDEVQVSLSTQNGTWYNGGGPVAALKTKFDTYYGSLGSRRAALRKVKFTILRTADPAPDPNPIYQP